MSSERTRSALRTVFSIIQFNLLDEVVGAKFNEQNRLIGIKIEFWVESMYSFLHECGSSRWHSILDFSSKLFKQRSLWLNMTTLEGSYEASGPSAALLASLCPLFPCTYYTPTNTPTISLRLIRWHQGPLPDRCRLLLLPFVLSSFLKVQYQRRPQSINSLEIILIGNKASLTFQYPSWRL